MLGPRGRSQHVVARQVCVHTQLAVRCLQAVLRGCQCGSPIKRTQLLAAADASSPCLGTARFDAGATRTAPIGASSTRGTSTQSAQPSPVAPSPPQSGCSLLHPCDGPASSISIAMRTPRLPQAPPTKRRSHPSPPQQSPSRRRSSSRSPPRTPALRRAGNAPLARSGSGAVPL